MDPQAKGSNDKLKPSANERNEPLKCDVESPATRPAVAIEVDSAIAPSAPAFIRAFSDQVVYTVRFSTSFFQAVNRGLTVDSQGNGLCATIVWAVCLIIMVLILTGHIDTTKGGRIASIVFCSLTSFYYILEAFGNPIIQGMYNQRSTEEGARYINILIDTKPDIGEHVTCYHYRNGQVNRHDGSARTDTTSKEVLHTEFELFKYSNSEDVTDTPDFKQYQLCLLKTSLVWDFGNATKTSYDEQKEKIQERHRHCDTHRDFETKSMLTG